MHFSKDLFVPEVIKGTSFLQFLMLELHGVFNTFGILKNFWSRTFSEPFSVITRGDLWSTSGAPHDSPVPVFALELWDRGHSVCGWASTRRPRCCSLPLHGVLLPEGVSAS